MNAGSDYDKAKALAQANADLTRQPWQMWLHNGHWYIQRVGTATRVNLVPNAEVVEPTVKEHRS